MHGPLTSHRTAWGCHERLATHYACLLCFTKARKIVEKWLHAIVEYLEGWCMLGSGPESTPACLLTKQACRSLLK